jgi:23S rRNA pseudouridine2605 synthase
VRAHGAINQADLDALHTGIEIEGVRYGEIEATLDREQGANVWITFAIREGKNREVRNVLAHLGLDVNRLIRISYGPFQLGELAEGAVEEVKPRILRDQLGERIARDADIDFDSGLRDDEPPRERKTKRGVVADREGRRVLVERVESARPKRDGDDDGPGPKFGPKRRYHGKRDRAPRD